MEKYDDMGNTQVHAGAWLALVASPIGNLEDITYRAVRTLAEADVIAAEDTRRSGILCRHYGITTKRIAYHAYNEHRKTESILERVKQGENVAVLSDAGMPGISDPGFLMVKQAREEGMGVHVIPGVSALTHAVTASGLPADRFLFAGYPPVKRGKRRTFIEEVCSVDATVFLFESPHRVKRLLEDVADICGPDIGVSVIREATKIYEECLCGRVHDVLLSEGDRRWRGEFVVGIDVRRKWEVPAYLSV